ncbi:GNAT family N-acetyltransferase [Phenylobacterium sp. NIBR 498073]|uniref:GNAT family N-acetyltransferase n=1 Tax=Phenylobacterium sp. NIBR 498073 TaxID=3015177 RepID=UPI0022B594D8|nr:GNAT family N-acetyltransferase [Phenylobacterium sp. NIBR 498073]WGU39467.1 GNAT family N-acetyltransferase [Phenylobacterium sp. NIBR 498073]
MSQDEILIRAAEPDDVPDLTETMNQPRAVWGTMQVPFTSVATRRERFKTTSATQTMLVAVIGGKVVGSLGLSRLEGRRSQVGTFGMAVHDGYAGRGVGTALLAAAVEQADRWLGLQRLELTVWSDNARAIALYERFGFEREGVMRSYAWRDGEHVDAIAMARLRP